MKSVIKPLVLKFFIILFAFAFFARCGDGSPKNALDHQLKAERINRSAFADAGPNIVAYTGTETVFKGWGASDDAAPLKFFWDFDSDGTTDWTSSENGIAAHAYHEPGNYTARLSVSDMAGNVLAIDSVRILVLPGSGEQLSILTTPDRKLKTADTLINDLGLSDADIRFLEVDFLFEDTQPAKAMALAPPAKTMSLPPDGNPKRYILIFNGGSERMFWLDAYYAYEMFNTVYGIPDSDIYLLNHDGTDPDGNNPNGMIDDEGTWDALQAAIGELSFKVDGDDLVFLFVTDHGLGYNRDGGRYLNGFASVDPGDEKDYLESNFKLRALYQGGAYGGGFGLNQTVVMRDDSQDVYYRERYVSHFTNVYFNNLGGYRSDNDIGIEVLHDFLEGDLNKDGRITGSEVMDYDGDGNPPYDDNTGIFDEDDWGNFDYYLDDWQLIHTRVPDPFNGTYSILDVGLDDILDIDLDYDPANPEINGSDLDGDGFFDFMDANDDKDLNDWVSIDEAIFTFDGRYIRDDELADALDNVNPAVMVIVTGICYGGGLIEDLSGPNRIIVSSTKEEAVSYVPCFLRTVIASLQQAPVPGTGGDPTQADTDNNGRISMTEMFNFAAEFDPQGNIEVAQYDDNGDGMPSEYFIPTWYDGALGSETYLDQWPLFEKFHNKYSDKLLTVTNSSDYAKVVCQGANSSWTSQDWSMEYLSSHEARLKNKWTGRYLTATSLQSYSDVVCQPLNTGWSSQRWILEMSQDSSSWRLRNKWSGLYLTVTSANEYASVKCQYLNTGWTSQQWYLLY